MYHSRAGPLRRFCVAQGLPWVSSDHENHITYSSNADKRKMELETHRKRMGHPAHQTRSNAKWNWKPTASGWATRPQQAVYHPAEYAQAVGGPPVRRLNKHALQMAVASWQE